VALTAAQRYTVLQALFATNDLRALEPAPNGLTLNQLLPGVTAQQFLSAVAAALGAAFDTQGTTVLNNLITILNAQVTSQQAATSALQTQVAAL
jgi:hypothetical protein